MKNTAIFFILKQFFLRFLILAFLVILKQMTVNVLLNDRREIFAVRMLAAGLRRLNATLQSRTLSAFCFTLKASFSSSKPDSKLLLKKFDFLFTFYSRSYRPGGPSYSPGVVTNWLFSTFQIFSQYKIWHF